MFEITLYTADKQQEWNDFVSHSKNGTFLFDRRYMDYHADRFADCSLMFWRKDRLYALLPANVVGDTLYSHQGLTYGGLVMGENVKAAEVCVVFAEMKEWLRANGIEKVYYKPTPWIYSTIPSEEDLYALLNVCHATLAARDISSTILLGNRPKFSELRKRCARKAQKAGVEIKESKDIATFWKILDDNLENKYGVHPVHTKDELELLAERFPHNIRLFMAYKEGNPLGGVVTYQNKTTVHTQYISASPDGKQIGALDLIFDELINHVFADFAIFDFGKSTERGGTYLNENLIHQKEGFGGRGVCYDTYFLRSEE